MECLCQVNIVISNPDGVLKPFYSCNKGWSDIYGLHHDSNEDKEGLSNSSERVKRLIAAEVANQIPPSRIVVAGTENFTICCSQKCRAGFCYLYNSTHLDIIRSFVIFSTFN